jgi:hypothetical protein
VVFPEVLILISVVEGLMNVDIEDDEKREEKLEKLISDFFEAKTYDHVQQRLFVHR